MKNAFLILLVSGTLAGPGAAQSYQPAIARLLEVSVPSTPLANPTGAITFAIGLPTPQYGTCQSPCSTPQPPYVSITPAFQPVTIGCGALGGAPQLAQAIASGITFNSGGTYVGTVSGSRVTVIGPPVAGQNDYWIGVFHGEIHQIYGLLPEVANPIVNLCDNVVGNEWGGTNVSNGAGIDLKFVTLLEDPTSIGNFEYNTGFVVPPNWGWDGQGQVSVEPNGFLPGPAPAGGFSGFPTSGNFFLRLSTQDPINPYGGPLKLLTSFRYNSSFPVLRFSYRWFNGEGGVNLSANDTFVARLSTNYWTVEVAREDTTTPLSAGVRTVEADLREIFWFANEGELISIEFGLSNGGYACCVPGPVNDSVVFIDDLSFPLPQAGEGNAVYPYGPSFRLETASWDLVHGLSPMSAADKRVAPGGALVLNFMLTQWGGPAGFPFVLMGSFVPYGSQPVTSLPGEPGVIGLDLGNAFPIWSGVWGWGYPAIPYFLPQGITTPDGLYVQAGIVDVSAPNGIRISNRIRHRVE